MSGTIYFRDLRIIQKQFSIVGVENKQELKPNSIILYQNYPNPFNPITTINFTIAKAGKVKIVVYNIQGQEIATLVDKHLPMGRFTTKFDGSKFTSGLYFYKLMSQDVKLIRKMMLIK